MALLAQLLLTAFSWFTEEINSDGRQAAIAERTIG